MAGRDPAIHDFLSVNVQVVDARIKSGHDEEYFPKGEVRLGRATGSPAAGFESPRKTRPLKSLKRIGFVFVTFFWGS